MTTTDIETRKIARSAAIRTVRLGDMRVSPATQREWKESRSHRMAEKMDFDRLGTLTVSKREGLYWLLDGQHRFYALREHLMNEFGDDWVDWTLEAWCYFDLDEREEAVKFLQLNEAIAPNAYDRFKVSVTADNPPAPDIDRIVRSLGLKVSRKKEADCISAVGALQRIYGAGGPKLLVSTLATISDAWGGWGYDSAVMIGLAEFLARYEGQIDKERLVKVLAKIRNGARGVQQSAGVIREAMGCALWEAVSASLVNLYNSGLHSRSAKRLTNWWKYTTAETDVD